LTGYHDAGYNILLACLGCLKWGRDENSSTAAHDRLYVVKQYASVHPAHTFSYSSNQQQSAAVASARSQKLSPVYPVSEKDTS